MYHFLRKKQPRTGEQNDYSGGKNIIRNSRFDYFRRDLYGIFQKNDILFEKFLDLCYTVPMEIYAVKRRTKRLCEKLMRIWETSVKATHTFLSDEERAKIGLYVPQAIKNVRHLIVAEINGSLVAFSGIEGKKTEMLFVAPENRGTGVGKALIGYAAERFGADTVTVNEQNPQAVGFYRHMGFETYRRTELDEQGNAYPILYMKKA